MKKFSPAFWRWFGQSQVVNRDGSPKVVYHGTSAKEIFTKFKIPSYFSESPEVANVAAGKSGRVYPVYLSIKNPAHLYEDEIAIRTAFRYAEVENDFYSDGGDAWELLTEKYNGSKVISGLKKLGYDGVMFDTDPISLHAKYLGFDPITYVPFSPEQIMPALITNPKRRTNMPKITYRVGKSPIVNLTATDWDLFSGHAGVGRVARSLNSAFNRLLKKVPAQYKKTRNMVKVGEWIRNEMYKVMDKYCDYGACDTEPEVVLVMLIEEVLQLPDNSITR